MDGAQRYAIPQSCVIFLLSYPIVRISYQFIAVLVSLKECPQDLYLANSVRFFVSHLSSPLF